MFPHTRQTGPMAESQATTTLGLALQMWKCLNIISGATKYSVIVPYMSKKTMIFRLIASMHTLNNRLKASYVW